MLLSVCVILFPFPFHHGGKGLTSGGGVDSKEKWKIPYRRRLWVRPRRSEGLREGARLLGLSAGPILQKKSRTGRT